MAICTVVERIILHLSNYAKEENDYQAPFGVCIAGIAENLGISEAHTSRELLRSKDKYECFFMEDLRHIMGFERKRKVYYLTQKGYKKADEILERIEGEKIKIRDGDESVEIRLGDAGKYLDDPSPIMVALKHLDDDKVLDLTKIKSEEDIFVGRQKELKRLKDIFEEVSDGRSKTVLIAGEAGIGKTRLVSEFERYAHKKGCVFLSGRAYYGTSEPYLPLREALEDDLDEDPIVEKPLFLLGVKDGPAVTEKHKLNGQRRSLWYDLGQILEEKASDKPLVIFLDDLQWADRSTILVLNYLANKISDSPILFIGTYRPEDIDDGHPLKELISHLTREHLLEKIELERLKKIYIRKISQRMIGRSDIPDPFIDVLHETTDGNPLFIRECVKYMLEEGEIDVGSDRYPTGKGEVNIPDIVEDVIERRIRNLEDQDAKKLLQLGAVIGDTIPFELLNSCIDMDVLELLDKVEKLMKYGLWYELPEEETFSFSHGLIQKGVHESIPDNLRKSLHLHVAEKIERVYRDENHRYWSDLGFHYEQGGKFKRAIDCYINAGDKATDLYAHEDAVDMYEKALRLMDKIGSKEDERASIIEKIGDTCKVLGEYEKSLEYYDLLLKIQEPDISPSVYRKMAYIMIEMGNFEGSLSQTEKGLEIVEPDSEEMCRLLLIKGLNLMMEGNMEDAIVIFNEEIDVAKGIKNKNVLARGYHDLAIVYQRLSKDDMSKEYLKEAIALREEIGDKEGLSLSYNNLGNTYVIQRKFDDALNYYQKSLELAEELGMDYNLGVPTMNIGIIKMDMGELDEADKYFERAKELFEMGDQKMNMCLVFINLAKIDRKRGALRSAYEISQRAFSLAKKIDYKRGQYLSLQLTAEILSMKGRSRESIDLLEKAITVCEESGHNIEIADTLLILGSVFVRKGEFDSAIKYYAEGKEIYDEFGYKPGVLNASINLAEAYARSGDLDEAGTHIELASDLYDESTVDDELKAEYHRVKGILLREESEYESALEELERSKGLYERLNDSPMLTETELEIGITMVRMGEEVDGLKIIRKVKEKAIDMGMMVSLCDEYLE